MGAGPREVKGKLASHGASVAIGYLKNDARAREVVKMIADAGSKAAAIKADLSRATEVTRESLSTPLPRERSERGEGLGVGAQSLSECATM